MFPKVEPNRIDMETLSKYYDTMVEAINDLKKKGYEYNFNLLNHGISSKELGIQYRPDSFHIDGVYRFEGESNPSDSSVLYAVSLKNGQKGLLVDAYGTYAAEVTPEMKKKLHY
jgi:hypothetical protein